MWLNGSQKLGCRDPIWGLATYCYLRFLAAILILSSVSRVTYELNPIEPGTTYWPESAFRLATKAGG